MDQKELEQVTGGDDMALEDSSPTDNRRMSREWGGLKFIHFLIIIKTKPGITNRRIQGATITIPETERKPLFDTRVARWPCQGDGS
jgi:hypothetical protein